jgi:hypothetical protein
MENRRIIKVEVPKEIWDADMSIFNCNRSLVRAWMESIQDVISQLEK